MAKKTNSETLEDARVLLAEIAGGLGEDHAANLADEGLSAKRHRSDEPKCSYCDWIKRAKKLAPEHCAAFLRFTA